MLMLWQPLWKCCGCLWFLTVHRKVSTANISITLRKESEGGHSGQMAQLEFEPRSVYHMLVIGCACNCLHPMCNLTNPVRKALPLSPQGATQPGEEWQPRPFRGTKFPSSISSLVGVEWWQVTQNGDHLPLWKDNEGIKATVLRSSAPRPLPSSHSP